MKKKEVLLAIFLILIIAGALFYYFTVVKDSDGKGAGDNVDNGKIIDSNPAVTADTKITGTLRLTKKDAFLNTKDGKSFKLYYIGEAKNPMPVKKVYKEVLDKNGKKTISINGIGLGGSFISFAKREKVEDKDSVEIKGDVLGGEFIRIRSIKKIE